MAIFRMCYGENGTVKFLETLSENVFRHNYSMVQIKKNWMMGKFGGYPGLHPYGEVIIISPILSMFDQLVQL